MVVAVAGIREPRTQRHDGVLDAGAGCELEGQDVVRSARAAGEGQLNPPLALGVPHGVRLDPPRLIFYGHFTAVEGIEQTFGGDGCLGRTACSPAGRRAVPLPVLPAVGESKCHALLLCN